MGVKRKRTSNRNKHGTAVEHGGPTQQGNKAFGHQCSDRAVSLADARGEWLGGGDVRLSRIESGGCWISDRDVAVALGQ